MRADASTLNAARLRIGSTTTLDLGGGRITARIVGRVDSPPGLGRAQGHLIADQRQLSSALTFVGADQEDPAFWWLGSGDSARTAAAAEAQPALGAVTTTARTAAALQADPFRGGLRRVLELVRYLAPGFAVIAFTVHAVVSTRERRKEFALLRAIGVRAKSLSALLGAEQVGLALFAVIPGALLGMALAAVVLPLVTVDDTGQAPYPPLPQITPWATVTLTALATALAISAIVLALARLLARVDLVRVLRAGKTVEPHDRAGGDPPHDHGHGGDPASDPPRDPRRPPLLACLAVLVLLLTALCAWAPALAGRQEDRALRQRVDAAQTQAPLISLSTTPEVFTTAPPAVDMASLLTAGRTLTEQLGSAARHLSFTGGSYDYDPASLLSPRPPGPANTSTNLTASYLPAARTHLRYISGQPPADHTPLATPPQIALSQTTAQALGVRTGSRLSLEFPGPRGPERTAPRDPVGERDLPRHGRRRRLLDRPRDPGPARALRGGTLRRHRARRPRTRRPRRRRPAGRRRGGRPRVTWQLRADLSGAAYDRARALTGPLSHYSADLSAARCQGSDWVTGDISCQIGDQTTGSLLVTDSLTPLLIAFTAQDHQARALATYAVDALAAVALATVAVAVRLLLRRRQPQLRLQRARGASTTRLVLLRCAVAWPVVVLAALLGWAVGRALAPTGASGSPQPLPAALATAAVLLTVPLMTWLAVREPHRPGRLRRTRRKTAVGRRVVLELTVLLATAAGVVALRSQGPDGILGAVPVLVALSVVLLLLRVYPLVLRLVLRQARRGRGTVGFIGAARAAHDAPATGLALFVLVLTLGTAVFGGLVQRTIGDGLATGAAWTSGADASATVAGTVAVAPGPPRRPVSGPPSSGCTPSTSSGRTTGRWSRRSP